MISSCVEVDYWSGGFVPGFVPYPSSERLIGCLGLYPSLIYMVDIVVALCLTSKCRGCVCKERSCVLLVIVLPQILIGGFPVWEVLCGQVSENPSV